MKINILNHSSGVLEPGPVARESQLCASLPTQCSHHIDSLKSAVIAWKSPNTANQDFFSLQKAGYKTSTAHHQLAPICSHYHLAIGGFMPLPRNEVQVGLEYGKQMRRLRGMGS